MTEPHVVLKRKRGDEDVSVLGYEQYQELVAGRFDWDAAPDRVRLLCQRIGKHTDTDPLLSLTLLISISSVLVGPNAALHFGEKSSVRS